MMRHVGIFFTQHWKNMALEILLYTGSRYSTTHRWHQLLHMTLYHHHFNYKEALGRDVHYPHFCLHYLQNPQQQPLKKKLRYQAIGYRSDNITHKISLYADDILLSIQNPEKSLTELVKLINDHSNISDYSINWNKSIILPLHKDFELTKIKNNPFKIGNITQDFNSPLIYQNYILLISSQH